MAVIDLSELRARSRHVVEKHHRDFPLIIWNYNLRCVADNAWDEWTRMARGLITTEDGEIVARPFRKFFAPGQHPEADPENWPTDESPTVWEKIDGSLGIAYWWDGDVHVATRGSFHGPQAEWATRWLRNTFDCNSRIWRRSTLLFEIVYPENRIVVDYGSQRGLVLIGAIDVDTAEDYWPSISPLATHLGMHAPNRLRVDCSSVEKIRETIAADVEGYVLHWPRHGLRVKVKGAEYLRIAKLLQHCSTTTIWEALRDGRPDLVDEMVERLPGGYADWAAMRADDLRREKTNVISHARALSDAVSGMPTRKEQAAFIMKADGGKYAKPAFLLLDGKDDEAEKVAWRMVKPEHRMPEQLAEFTP